MIMDLKNIIKCLFASTWLICALQTVLASDVNLDNGLDIKSKVILGAEYGEWRFSSVPNGISDMLFFLFRDLEGNIIKQLSGLRSINGKLNIKINGLPVGYYDIELLHGSQIIWKSSLVVLPSNSPPRELRFGIDAGVSWEFGGVYNQDPTKVIELSFKMMRMAGIGSVRDRMGWWKVQKSDGGRFNWGVFDMVADRAMDHGLDLVQIIDAAPYWMYPQLNIDHLGGPPLEYNKVYEFGRNYALGLGKKVRNVEYWNEQNSPNYYDGYPFQYASGLKAFYAGVKSVDPGIKVLIGALDSGDPYQGSDYGKSWEYQNETYANNVFNFFDVRNMHFYNDREEAYNYTRKLTTFDTFYNRNFASLDRAYGLINRPGWLTETGFRFYTGEDSDRNYEIKQAQYLIKAYVTGFATGFERVFFFFWPYLVEHDKPYYKLGQLMNFKNWECKNGMGVPPDEQFLAQGHNKYQIWGITRCDASLRPAYLALAKLTRHLEGASIVGFEKYGEQARAVYFRRANDADSPFIAVTWGVNSKLLKQPGILAQDIFGRHAVKTDTSAPLFVTNIKKLPTTIIPVALPRAASLPVKPLWLETRVFIDKNEVLARHQRPTFEIQTQPGQIIKISVRAHKGDIKIIKSPTLKCSSGSGLIKEFEGWFDDQFVCEFTVGTTIAGSTNASVVATLGNESDSARVAFRVIPYIAEPFCAIWNNFASSKTKTDIYQQKSSCAFTVKSEFNEGGDIWVFPWASITHQSMLSSRSGVRVQLANAQGWGELPPGPLQMTLWENAPNGEKWLLNLEKLNPGTYFALFKDAKKQVEGGAGNNRLDLEAVTRILLGRGDYIGKPGKWEINIKAINWLQTGSALVKGERFLPISFSSGQQLVSANGRFKVLLDQDWNLMRYDALSKSPSQIHKFNTIFNQNEDSMKLQNNGDVIIFDAKGKKKWSSAFP
jgi:hypothetical protein